MRERIEASVREAISAARFLARQDSFLFIEECAVRIASCFEQGGKLLIAGNGGSLCDAMHFAEEMTGIFREKRPALPAVALSCPGHLTCTANDLGFEDVFARGVEALGRPGDLLIALTTSGNSPNLLRAVEIAQQRELGTVAFLGRGGGRLKGVCDLELIVEGFPFSDRVQEVHMAAIHIIVEVVEQTLFYPASAKVAAQTQ